MVVGFGFCGGFVMVGCGSRCGSGFWFLQWVSDGGWWLGGV